MQRFRQHIALLLLLVLSVFTFPQAFWHHHEEPVTIAHQNCDHTAHLAVQEPGCAICQLHTQTFFNELISEYSSILPILDYSSLENEEGYSTQNFALPFLRGPPLLG